MSIRVESQTVITCDLCLDTFIEVLRRKDCIKLARERGWSIGKETICPRCLKSGEHP